MSAENGTLLNDLQMPIASSAKAIHGSNGKRIREVFVRALVANGVSQGTIARETEREPSAITRMLSGEQAITPDVLAAIFAHDLLGTAITGLAAMVGWEATPRKPDPIAENRLLRSELARIREEVDRVLSLPGVSP